jgi:hypothetical protein
MGRPDVVTKHTPEWGVMCCRVAWVGRDRGGSVPMRGIGT